VLISGSRVKEKSLSILRNWTPVVLPVISH
jgi:hypothetical protein